MLELIRGNMSEIVSFLAGLAGGSFLTFHVTRDQRAAGKATISDQRRAHARGDVVGRDKVTGASVAQDPPNGG